MYKELIEKGLMGEIDAVQRAFETSNSATHDLLSYRYFELIDLATSPEPIATRLPKIDRRQELMQEYSAIVISILRRHDVLDLFDSHMDQVSFCVMNDVVRERNEQLVA